LPFKFFILEKFGKISVITIVHKLQIVESVIRDEFDTKVEYIVTPNQIIKCQNEK